MPRRPKPPDPRELTALLHLRLLPGVGDGTIRTLVQRFGSARAALAAPAAALGPRAAVARNSPAIQRRIRHALKVIDSLDVQVIVETDPDYPGRLRHLHDPPYILFARGRVELLKRPAVAMVGSRDHTRDGAEAARLLAREVGRAGLVVVSGMARGIDAQAHRAALPTGTIGVLGCGIDVVYPRHHRKLQEQMATEGLLLSEFVPAAEALAHHFPRRNRIIAALALGVVVVEAAAKSGALITVDHATDLGREVFAVPGPITRETSVGTNALIQDGAKLVTCGADVLEELGVGAPVPREPATPEAPTTPPPPPDLTGVPRRLWEVLATEPRHVDALARACELSPSAAVSGLLELELMGHARQLPGMRFVRS